MARQALSTDQVKIEQRPPVDLDTTDLRDRESDVIVADPSLIDEDYAASLAFYDEPVTIIIQPSTEKNAAQWVPVWVNGKPPLVLVDGRWAPYFGGYLPTNEMLTVKRCVVEVLARAKITNIQHDADVRREDHQNNRIVPTTIMAHSFTVVRDENPKGPAWLREQIRRNF